MFHRLILLNLMVLLTLSRGQNLDFLDTLLVKDYKPSSIYNIPTTEITKSKFPIIDMHSHAYPESEEEIAVWINNMEDVLNGELHITDHTHIKLINRSIGCAIPVLFLGE